MRARTLLVVAGTVVTAKLLVDRRLHRSGREQHRGEPCHGHHGPMAYLEHSEWRGLTEDEARVKLASRHGDDQTAVDAAVEYLDERGYLARSAAANS